VLAGVVLTLLGGCARKRPVVPAWESIPLGTDAEVEDLWFADSLNGWLVGGGYQIEGGLVGRTRDGGRTWAFTSGLASPEPGVFGFNLLAVRFLDAQRGLVAGDGGKVFATDDAGDHWRLVRYGRGSTDHLFGFDFLDAQNGWASGLGGVIRTRDAGETWTDVSLIHPDIPPPIGHAIHFFNASNGLLVGPYASLMRSADGGETWTALTTPLATAPPIPPAEDRRPRLNDLTFVDALHGWAVGTEGTVLRTTDGGESWRLLDTGVEGARSHPVKEMIQRRRGVVDTLDLGGRTPGLTLTAVRFVDERRGWITGHFGYEGRSIVLGTGDGGDTWQIECQVSGEELRALFVLDAEHAWAVGDRVRPGQQVLLRRTPASIAAASQRR